MTEKQLIDDVPELQDKLDRIKQEIEKYYDNKSNLDQLIQHPSVLTSLLGQFKEALTESEKVIEEFSDLSIIHSTVVEHSTEIENELTEQNEKTEQIMRSMKKYLSTQLFDLITAEEIDQSQENQHKRRQLTIFFSDIVGFTDITDRLSGITVLYIKLYLNKMASIALKWGGVIDKFIGDAVMIYFGDNDKMKPEEEAKNCVLMALEMQKSIEALRKEWSKKGVSQFLQIRIGINTGYCTVGNFGSQERMDYTIIGGAVNAASRLEGQSNPGGILISESTHSLVHDEVECIERGKVHVKGISHSINTYEVIGKRIEDENSELIQVNSNGFKLSDFEFDENSSSTIEKEEMKKALERAIRILN